MPLAVAEVADHAEEVVGAVRMGDAADAGVVVVAVAVDVVGAEAAVARKELRLSPGGFRLAVKEGFFLRLFCRYYVEKELFNETG